MYFWSVLATRPSIWQLAFIYWQVAFIASSEKMMASCRMAESQYPSQQQDKFILRLPDGMRERIKVVAELNNRSMNAEIVAILEDHFGRASSHLPLDFARRIDDGESPIKVWREFLGLTRRELALKSSIEMPVITKIENGQRYGSVKTLQKLADAMGVGIDDLV